MGIQHFSHQHALELEAAIFDAFCGICNGSIQWKHTYTCRRCLYIIHVTCAELPEHINHSLHPLHPLKLAKRSLNNDNCCYYCEEPFNNDEYVYGCDDHLCYNFYMHRTCAMVPLPTITSHGDGGKDLDVLQYACHQKPMILMEHLDRNERRATCFVCRLEYTSGSTYSCKSIDCKNFIHKSCVELPQKIRHPFHPHHILTLQVGNRSCRSCCKKSSKLIFSCHESGCNFNLGIECASQNKTIKHQSHDHSLALVEKSSCVIQCEACQKSYKNLVIKEINHTQSFVFRCMDCDFDYHFLCGPLPSTIRYKYHMHHLILSGYSIIKDVSDKYYCDVCEEEMDRSFRIYYCEECKYAAHIHCLISEIMKVIKGDTNDVELKALGEHRWDQYLAVESMGHQHVQVNKIVKDIMDTLTEQEIEMLKDPFSFGYPNAMINMFKFYQQRNSRFNLERSNEDIDRLVIQCDHSLALVEKSSCVIQCEACQKSYKNLVLKEINHTQSFIFRCMDCDFNYHFLCGPLPSTLKYEYHMHRLILSDHLVTKDDSDKYYCEMCEEEADQSFRIYYCEECKYTAHIHCLISEIMKVIKGDTNDVELKALEEHRWDQYLAVESMGHQHVQVNKTLKDIMDTLTEQEIERLKDPFFFGGPNAMIQRFKFYQQRNSRFNLERSNEDVDRLFQFFLFNTNPDDFYNFCSELWWFSPEEGLLKLLDEKYLRQQVEDVDGYMVPKTLALVLKSLLHKYGDLGGRGSLSSAMKSIASTLLCVVLDKMCKTKMEDVTRDDLKHFCFYIIGIRSISGFNIGRFYKDRLQPGFSLKAFLGFEAIKYEKETCKNLDNWIVFHKDELERWEKNRVKFETYRSQKSDFMKECLSEASAWKNKYFGDTWF